MNIHLPAGIGDIYWVLQKLSTTGEKYTYYTTHERGKQVLELLPQYVSKIKDSPHSNGDVLRKNECIGDKRWSRLPNHPNRIVTANKWVDNGGRLENWLPDLDTNWGLAHEFDVMPTGHYETLQTHIGIYTSSLTNVMKFQPRLWTHHEWYELIKRFEKDCHFSLIGAEYDRDLLFRLAERLGREGISFDLIIRPLREVVDLMYDLDYFIGRASGLGILADGLDVPSIMLYPWHETKLMQSWHKPRKEEIYQGMLFDKPEKVFEKIPKRICCYRKDLLI